MYSEKIGASQHSHSGAIDGQQGECSIGFPEASYDLLGLLYIQDRLMNE